MRTSYPPQHAATTQLLHLIVTYNLSSKRREEGIRQVSPAQMDLKPEHAWRTLRSWRETDSLAERAENAKRGILRGIRPSRGQHKETLARLAILARGRISRARRGRKERASQAPRRSQTRRALAFFAFLQEIPPLWPTVAKRSCCLASRSLDCRWLRSNEGGRFQGGHRLWAPS